MSPQKENGYTPIAHELLEAFYRCKLLEYERVVILCIWRKTYGWGKKEDWISNSQLSDETGIAMPNITRTRKLLRDKKITIDNEKKVGINKNYGQWNVEWRLSHQITKPPEKVISPDNKVISPDNKKLSHQIPTKEKKDTIQKQLAKTIKNMYNYEPIDENGNPTKKRIKRITKHENDTLISVGFLWQEMCAKELDLEKEDIPMKNIYHAIRACYDRNKFSRDEFKELFKYFLSDNLKPEMKLSFDLCLSEKYVAKFKLSKKLKSKKFNSVSVSSDIKL